jgi:hypothetical protein
MPRQSAAQAAPTPLVHRTIVRLEAAAAAAPKEVEEARALLAYSRTVLTDR